MTPFQTAGVDSIFPPTWILQTSLGARRGFEMSKQLSEPDPSPTISRLPIETADVGVAESDVPLDLEFAEPTLLAVNDPVLVVDQVKKNEKGEETLTRITAVDDTATNVGAALFNTATDDPQFRFAAPADGTFRITVRDRAFESRGDPALVYRLSVHKESPDFRIVALPTVPTSDPNAQAGQWDLSIRKGDNAQINVMAFRNDGFTGVIDISVEVIESKKTSTDDDFITNLVRANVEGDALSYDELLNMVSLLIFGGFDTTRNQLGLAMKTFAEHPDQWQLLRTGAVPIKSAIEEILRWDPPLQFFQRWVLDDGFEPGRVYELDYAATGARVAGVGLAAVRDAAAAFRSRADLPIRGQRAYVFGISQSGRFLRHMLYEGFNEDENGHLVFDGVIDEVGGAGRGSFNHRFGQASRDAEQFFNFLYPVDMFPFTDADETDADTGAKGSLLGPAQKRNVEPKIFHVLSNSEYFNRGGSLVHADPQGKSDVPLPPAARIIDVTPGRIREAITEGAIPIVAGFQGVSQDTKDVTTLGRGGSDTTAVALAAALGAEVCEIYTEIRRASCRERV